MTNSDLQLARYTTRRALDDVKSARDGVNLDPGPGRDLGSGSGGASVRRR